MVYFLGQVKSTATGGGYAKGGHTVGYGGNCRVAEIIWSRQEGKRGRRWCGEQGQGFLQEIGLER